jgi:hypothetical protein
MNPSASNSSNNYFQNLNDRLYFRQKQLNHSALFYCTNQSQNQQDDDYNDEEPAKYIYQTILPINVITPISLDRFNYLEYLNNNYCNNNNNNNCYSNNIYDQLTPFYDSLLYNQKQDYITNQNEEDKLSLAQVQSNKQIKKRYSMNEQSLSINNGLSKSSSIKYRFSLKAISNKITTSVENIRNKFNTNTQSTKSFNKLSLPNRDNLTINDDSSYMLLRSAQNLSIHVRNAETDYDEDDLEDNMFYNKREIRILNDSNRESPNSNTPYEVNYLLVFFCCCYFAYDNLN